MSVADFNTWYSNFDTDQILSSGLGAIYPHQYNVEPDATIMPWPMTSWRGIKDRLVVSRSVGPSDGERQGFMDDLRKVAQEKPRLAIFPLNLPLTNHWGAVAVVPSQNGGYQVTLFDSFGISSYDNRDWEKVIKSLHSVFGEENTDLQVSHKAFQIDGSSCGALCVEFCARTVRYFRNNPDAASLDITSITNSLFGNRPAVQAYRNAHQSILDGQATKGLLLGVKFGQVPRKRIVFSEPASTAAITVVEPQAVTRSDIVWGKQSKLES